MPDNDAVWEQGWDSHDREQLIRLSRLSLAQKLQWLEEAHRLVRQLKGNVRSPRQSDATSNP